MAAECECELEHSIVKLGHCGTCPYYRSDQATQIDYSLGGCSMQDGHTDGTPHDFGWATYEDETMGTGVCRCGLTSMHFDMARMP